MAEIRTRLGRELEELANEMMLGRLAGRAAGGEPEEADCDRAVHRRIGLLGQLIAGLETAEAGTLWDDRAGYGSTVFLRDLDSGQETFCTLVAGGAADEEPGRVPLGSPLGRALLGCRAGDEPVVRTRAGPRRLRVFAVHTLPRSLGMTGGGPPDAA
ncbi:GreA/GreB family elongation factor [Longimicrobium sp.]|uniref:GreA/GreB family elongation factor n=1 Tax=Longimicrobium sp. TaxID=2029185 RepID=UPI002E36B4F7|nr:GreA/GreB family elongation factor [Longimicrobium sp.]HEX6036892.1 GreA/GreB family elongation factor [Longimicrobium sp.]